MNIYTTRFSALCPVNGQGIDYTLTIQTGEILMVETIREVLDGIKEGLHEHIADQLCDKFGGSQRLKAMHHGVEIETIRPHLAHWQAPSEQKQPKTPEQIAKEDREWADYASGVDWG